MVLKRRPHNKKKVTKEVNIIAWFIVDVLKDEKTKHDPAMVSAVAELMTAFEPILHKKHFRK